MRNKICFITCEYFEPEFAAVVGSEEFKDVLVETFPADCNNSQISSDKLIETINACKSKDICNQIHIFSGFCIKEQGDLLTGLKDCYLHRVDQCLGMFIGSNLIGSYYREGACLLTPGLSRSWLRFIKNCGLDQQGARKLFGETVTKLILLDTGADPEGPMYIKEIADFFNLPFEIIPVGLDFFRLFLSKIVFEWRMEKYKFAAAALIDSERIAHIGDYKWDLVNNELYWSDECYCIFGLAPQAFVLTFEKFLDMVHPDDRGFVKKYIDGVLRGEKLQDLDYRIEWPDGSVRFVNQRCETIFDDMGKVIQMRGTIQDITGRKRSEKETKLLQTVAFGIATSGNLSDALIFVLKELCTATGWVYGEAWIPNEEGLLLERDHTYFSRVKGLEKFSEHTEGLAFPRGEGLPGRAWVARQPMWISDVSSDPQFKRTEIAREVGLKTAVAFPVITDNEVVAIVVFYAVESKEPDEQFLGTVSMVMTQVGMIIKRKQVEEALRNSEEKLKSILDNAMVCIYVKDIQGRYIFINKECEALFRVKKNEAKGKTDFEIWPKEIAESNRINDWEVIETREPLEFKETVTLIDGLHHFYTVKFPLSDPRGNIYAVCGISKDVTNLKRMEEEKKKLREQLYHTQKLESVGKLAGGIAHEFNNILMAIAGYASLLQIEIRKDDPMREYVQNILTSSEKAAGLTRDLLTFSRKQENNPQPESLNELIRKTERLLTKLTGEDIKFRTALTNKNPVVMIDRYQFEQVLMNLVINARDAMPEGGILTITTDIVELDDAFLRSHGYGEIGNYALMTVSDTGLGMDERTRERIFEPFFTTKEVGKGTGLGLSIVYGIIKQHSGYINVDSVLDKGTTFMIYLPLIDEVGAKTKSKTHPSRMGAETILIAEDDPGVRKLIKTILEVAGYNVITAVDGDDAVNKFMANRDIVRFLVFDVRMPGKNGKEAYFEIKKTRPDIKVLFISGYGSDIINKKMILKEGLKVISKPVLPAELLKHVREMMYRNNV